MLRLWWEGEGWRVGGLILVANGERFVLLFRVWVRVCVFSKGVVGGGVEGRPAPSSRWSSF